LTYDEDVFARMSPSSQKKALQVFAGTDNAYRLARKYKIKTAFGADILFDAGLPAGRKPISPAWSAGTRLPRRSGWRAPTMAS
jgi:hypothetical protein